MKTITFRTSLKPLEIPKLVDSVEVAVELSGSRLRLEYFMKTTQALAWESTSPGFCETLWKKTAFEIFIADRGSERYWEWNFAAPQTWGAFSFEGLRSRTPTEARRDAGLRLLEIKNGPEGIALVAELDLAFSEYLAWVTLTGSALKHLAISLNTISETASGERVHWALKHAANAQANFHRRDNFVDLASLVTNT